MSWVIFIIALLLSILYGIMFLRQSKAGLTTTALDDRFTWGLYVQGFGLSTNQLLLILLICACGALIGLIPGYRVYKYSLADGMTVRL